VILLLRLLEVTDAPVRLEGIRSFKAMLHTSGDAARRLTVAVSHWPDLLLRVVHGLGGGARDECDLCYDEVILVLDDVVQWALRCSSRGWLQLRQVRPVLGPRSLPSLRRIRPALLRMGC
jgi:hypothetical protein